MNYHIEHNIKGKQYSFDLEDRIPFVEFESIVEQIVNGVFDEDGKYIPYRYDYYHWFLILHKASTLDVENMPVDELYELIDNAEFVDKIKSVLSVKQLDRIWDATWEMIHARLNENPLNKVCKKALDLMSSLKVLLESFRGDNELMDEFKEALSLFASSEEGKKIVSILNHDSYNR